MTGEFPEESTIFVMRKICTANRVALVLPLLLVLAGCQQRHWRVNIASGYSGPVSISCGAFSDESRTITVDSTGHADKVFCPVHPTELLIVRDGKTISPENPMNWLSTGDGITVGVEFIIR